MILDEKGCGYVKVLVVGGGGREHALVWKISQSPRISKIYSAPGNGGIADLAEPVSIQATDIDGMVDFATKTIYRFSGSCQMTPFQWV